VIKDSKLGNFKVRSVT